MPKLNIQFDLDGVLVDYHSHLKSFLAARGIEMLPSGHWFFDTFPKVEPGKIMEYINESIRDVDDIHPKPGAKHVCRVLYELTGEPITIITSRSQTNTDVTIQSIERVLGDIPYLFAIVKSAKDKPKYIRTKCFIDDRRRTAVDLARRGHTVFMPEYEYNWPIKVQEGFSVCYKGLWEHAGIWKRTDGQIIVIDDIECLLHPDNLRLIVS